MDFNELTGAKQNPSDGEAPIVTLAELENSFRTPTQRQADYEPQPEPAADGSLPLSLINPDGDTEPETVETVPLDPEKAQRTGMRIARLADTGIDFVLSNFVAHNDETYRASEGDLQDIAEAWGEIAQEKGWDLGPGITLLILYAMVYGPLVKQAVTDRRIADMERRQALIEQQQAEMQQQLNEMRNGNTAEPEQHAARPAGVDEARKVVFRHEPAPEQ